MNGFESIKNQTVSFFKSDLGLGHCVIISEEIDGGKAFRLNVNGWVLKFIVTFEQGYINITSILLPANKQRKGNSIRIIAFFSKLANEHSLMLLISDICNAPWKMALLRRNGVLQSLNYDDEVEILADEFS